MTVVGREILIRGELHAADDLTIEGRVEGPVWCEGRAVTIAATAQVAGDVIARDITVFGRVKGTLVASEVVDLRSGALLTGRVVAARFILSEGATFEGSAEPQHLEAALRVARHRHAPVVTALSRRESPDRYPSAAARQGPPQRAR